MKHNYLAIKALLWREIMGFLRQRSRLIGAVATPLLFWLLIGGGFGSSFQSSGTQGSYMNFFFPGMLALNVLFTAIFSTISVIKDRHEGFLQGVLVSPASRGVFVAAKILGGATLGLIQGALLLTLAPFAGFEGTIVDAVLVLVLLFFMAGSLTALSFLFAWKLDSVQGFHSIMNTVLMPMWLLSGAMFPAAGSYAVLRWIMRVNPLTYAVDSLRELFVGSHDHLGLALAVMIGGGAVLYAASYKLVNRGL